MANEETGKTATTGGSQPRLRVDTANMKSAYSNFFAAQDNPNEVVLNFGFNQRWDSAQKDQQVQMLQQVILHPATARQVRDALVALFEKRDARRALVTAQADSAKKSN